MIKTSRVASTNSRSCRECRTCVGSREKWFSTSTCRVLGKWSYRRLQTRRSDVYCVAADRFANERRKAAASEAECSRREGDKFATRTTRPRTNDDRLRQNLAPQISLCGGASRRWQTAATLHGSTEGKSVAGLKPMVPKSIASNGNVAWLMRSVLEAMRRR